MSFQDSLKLVTSAPIPGLVSVSLPDSLMFVSVAQNQTKHKKNLLMHLRSNGGNV